MPARRPIARIALLTLFALALVAEPAAAATIWTPVPSGTTSDITAIYYRGGDQFWFGTGNGEIFKRSGATFTRVSNTPGTVIQDIEFQPGGGGVGLAVGTNGKVLRTTNGTTWTAVALPVLSSATGENTCNTTAAAGDLDGVRFAGDGRAFIFGPNSQIAVSPLTTPNTSTVGTAGTWKDANKNGSNCFVAKDIDDAFFIDADTGYLVSRDFGAVYFTGNHVTSTLAEKAADAGNGFTTRRRVAGDITNPNRMWAVTNGGGGSYLRYTTDGWSTSDGWTVVNTDDTPTMYDIASSGGSVLSAGNAGMVLHSIDGRNFYADPAPGTLATADWRAVDLASATDGAIGGTNGALAVTTAANTIPDIVAPTGTIVGPSTATAGTPVTFTAAVADNAGGSGIDPAGFAWTATGTAGGSGASVNLTFPAEGGYTVQLSFRDLAGNTATASTFVLVSKAAAPVDARPAPAFTLTGSGNGASARVSGGKVKIKVKGKIKVPAGVNKASACKGTVLLTIKKGKTLLTARNAKLGKTCTFSKTISLSASKVKGARKLAVTVRFQGNSVLKPKTQNLSVKIKR